MTSPRIERPNLAGLRVRSARLTYGGPGRLDVTARSKSAIGARLAPSEGLLWPFITRRREAEALENRARAVVINSDEDTALRWRLFEEAEELEDQVWREYVPAYLAERRVHAGLVHHREWADHTDLEKLAWHRGVRPRPEDWMRLRDLAAADDDGPLLVFCCFCAGNKIDHCHRYLLRACCAKLGAIDEGEVPLEEQRRVTTPKKGPSPT